MSYDLRVYGARLAPPSELEEIAAAAGLCISPTDKRPVRTVVRGVRERYSFTLAEGSQLEREDVPDEITALMLDASVLYDLGVEGSATAEIPHAIRFARRLAAAVNGVVEDPQLGTYWTRGKLRRVEPVESKSADTVELYWFAPIDSVTRAPEIWLSSARRWLPEALPRRFGVTEPLQSRLDRDGDQRFVKVQAEEDSMVHFAGIRPCLGGSMYGGVKDNEKEVAAYGLSVDAAALNDSRWRAAVREFFVGFAERIGAFAATADFGYSGVFLANLSPCGKWMGLQPYPVSWAWFGPEYLELIGDAIDPQRTTSAGSGRMLTLSDMPVPHHQLPAQSWVPSEYRAIDLSSSGPTAWQSMSLHPAVSMPAGLRPDKLERRILEIALERDAAGITRPRRFDMAGYEPIELPYGVDFAVLTPAKARQTFNLLMDEKDHRKAQLVELLVDDRLIRSLLS